MKSVLFGKQLVKLVRGWAYSATSDGGGRRDLRIDLLRGFAVFAMVADHIGGESSWLYAITGGDRFFVSAAEIFVVVSGLTMGMVYRGVLAREGIRGVLIKAVNRAYFLYVLTVCLTLATATLALAFQLPWASALSTQSAADFVWSVITLQRTYYLTDVLLLYTFLVFIAGPVLALMALGGTWPVVASSWCLWLVWQLHPEQAQLPWPIADNTAFPLAAWQIYFFTAVAIGFHRRSIVDRVAVLHPVLLPLASGFLAAGLFGLHQYVSHAPAAGAETEFTWWLAELFYKYDVRAGRIVAVLVFAIAGYSLLTQAWAPARRALSWFLLPLGQHALTAYALHLFLIPLATLAVQIVRPGGVMSATENTGIQLIGVLTIWFIVVMRPRMAARSQLVGLSTFRWSLGLLAVAASLGLAVGGAHMWAPARSGSDKTEDALLVNQLEQIPVAVGPHQGVASRVERSVFHSAALGREMPYTVYVPSGYDESTHNRYPTLYMLHGMGGHNTEWEGYGLLQSADSLIAAGEIDPIIIVLPQGDQSYWVDWADGGPAWGLYVARDLVDHVDLQFRTVADPTGRAVGGLSMGAHGALQLGLRYPRVFGIVGAHSPSLRSFDERLPYFGD
jgi:enterochelin esterase-like enzyme